MDKVLLSAFACDPTKGSEPSNGWNWAEGLAQRGYDVCCLTRQVGKSGIESRIVPGNLKFYYVVLPFGLESLYTKGTVGMYIYYLLWQWFAFRKALELKKVVTFKLIHHVTWGSIQMGSYLYKLGVPFVFGPSGGGQKAPVAFKKYFLNHWKSEEKREKVSGLLMKFNPGFRTMLKRAHTILVSNSDTYDMVKSNGAKNVILTLDAALPEGFFPEIFEPKLPQSGTLKLLWVGRFMPRKGVLLLLDVMKELKVHKKITLTVVGDGEMREEFLNTIKEYELENTVDWKGAVPFESVRGFYASHDVFFFTSLRDSCPAQLIEAMAFGQPVITLNLHGQGLIVNDKTGIRCPCDTPEIAISALKKAILNLYEHPEVVRSMSLEANHFARQQNWNNKITTIINQYYPS